MKWASYGVALYALTGTVATIISCALGLRAGAIGVGLIALSQLASMTAMRQRLGIRPVWRIWPVSVPYTMALFVWLPLTALLMPRVHWRGEGYDVRYQA